MRYISVFSGIEAASVAAEPLGWKPVAFSEIDPFACAVLAHRYPDVPNLGDMTKIDWSAYAGKADLVVGGSPCQSFSLAGKRTGLDGPSGLMWEYVRCIREVMPKFLVWENVPGALSSTHGEDFRCLLESLDDLGYCLAWRVLDASLFGIPQRRRRVYLVGCFADKGVAAVLFESESLHWDFASSAEKRKELAADARRRSCSASLSMQPAVAIDCRNHVVNEELSATLQSKPNGGVSLNFINPIMCMSEMSENSAVDTDVAGTIMSRTAKAGTFVSDGYTVRRLTPIECERLMGLPDNWTDVPYYGGSHSLDTPRYRVIGNSMAVPVMRWIFSRIYAMHKSQLGGIDARTQQHNGCI